MSDNEKRPEFSKPCSLEKPLQLKLRPENIPTVTLLNGGSSDNFKKLMKNDSDIMKAYDLNEENLKNLKHLRKYSFAKTRY